ncbi:MAG: hypothetical protein ACOZCL_15445 [Bacillota bacterium]
MINGKRQVEALAWHDLEGVPEPYRVKYELYGELVILKIRTIHYEKKQLPDNTLYMCYECESIGYETNKNLNLEYDMGTGKWYMVHQHQ